MHGAAICNFQQPRTLLLGQRTSRQRDGARKQIDLLSAAEGCILCVDFVVAYIDADMLQRPLLAPLIHADGHQGTGPKAGRQKPVGRHAHIGAAIGQWLIGQHVDVAAGGDVLQEAVGICLGYAHHAFGGADGGAGKVRWM